MIKTFSIITYTFFAISCFGQTKTSTPWFTCYLPNGLKCSNILPTDNTIEKVGFHFEPKARTWTASTDLDESIHIVFKSFTMEALFILAVNKKPYSSEKIKEFIQSIDEDNSSYNYYFGTHKYGHHWGVKANIKTFIKEKILDESFLLSTLGSPVEIKDSLFDGKPAKCFVYLIEGVRIYFVEGFAVGMDELK